MKKIYLIAIVAFLSSGCEKNIENAQEDLNRPCVLSAGIQEASTRVSVADDNDLTTSWTKGDLIKIQTGTNTWADYTLSTGAGTKKAVFGGDGVPGGDKLAVYPGGRLSNNGSFTFPSSFTYATADGEGNLINSNNGHEYGSTVVSEVPMVSEVKGSAGKYHCSFDYVAGAIKIKYNSIPLDARRLVMTAEGTPFTGVAALNGTDALSISEGGNRIEVNFNDGGHEYGAGLSKESLSFMIPVPEGTYSKLRIWVERYFPNASLGFPQGYSKIPGSGVGTNNTISISAGSVLDVGEVGAGNEYYRFEKVTRGSALGDGTYILVYEKDANNVIVNCSSPSRAVFVKTVENGLIKLNYSEYVAGIWVVEARTDYYGDTTWTVHAARYGDSTLTVEVEWANNGYIEMTEDMNWRTGYTRYLTQTQLQQWTSGDYSDSSMWGNGEFVSTTNLNQYLAPNLSLYKCIDTFEGSTN